MLTGRPARGKPSGSCLWFCHLGQRGFMREQVCKYICPHARFQSVMFDRDTMIVTYDC